MIPPISDFSDRFDSLRVTDPIPHPERNMNRRLNCEALEARSLPAVTASQVQGVLTVHLSNDSDSVQIGSATSDRVRVSGTGLGATFFTDVEELYVSDTGGGSGGASRSVVIQDTAMADRLTIPGAVAITGIENVTFSSPFYDLSVGRFDVLVGSGEGSPSRVRAYLGKNFSGGGEPSLFQDLDPYNGAVLTDGVYVA